MSAQRACERTTLGHNTHLRDVRYMSLDGKFQKIDKSFPLKLFVTSLGVNSSLRGTFFFFLRLSLSLLPGMASGGMPTEIS